MKSTLFVAALAVSSVGFAGTFSGKGKAILGGKVEMDYTTTLTVEVIEKDKSAKFTELTKLANGEVINEVHRLQIGDKGVVTVFRGDVVIGTGYCFRQKDGGKWCDYRAQTAAGILHQNFYHDATNHMVHRMGDMTSNDGNGFWSDSLLLQN
jgi:hypothetical protein